MEEAVEPLSYKQLYHASVERYANLQEQLERHSGLLSKHKKITELKDNVLFSLAKKETALDAYHKFLTEKEQTWRETVDSCLSREKQLEREHSELVRKHEELRKECAGHMTRAAIARAECRTIKDYLIKDIESRATADTEKKCKRKFFNYSQSLKRKNKELQDSLEFSEAERTSLVEANSEIESKLKMVTSELKKKELALEEAKSELGKKEKPHLVVLPENLADSGCSTCTELRRQLSRVTEVLNDRGCANYGDLLHSKFLLEQKVKSMELKMLEGLQEYQRLTNYIQEYKLRSVEKVNIMKDNIKKADGEIAELDKLIETVREAMHCSMNLVQQSPYLLKALREIDGTDHIYCERSVFMRCVL